MGKSRTNNVKNPGNGNSYKSTGTPVTQVLEGKQIAPHGYTTVRTNAWGEQTTFRGTAGAESRSLKEPLAPAKK